MRQEPASLAARRFWPPCSCAGWYPLSDQTYQVNEFDAGHVALVVEAQTAENRVEFIVAQSLDHGSGIEGARLLDRLRPDLNHGVRRTA